MKIWIYWAESNSWNYFYIQKTEKFTGPSKVLLVLGREDRWTGAYWRTVKIFLSEILNHCNVYPMIL